MKAELYDSHLSNAHSRHAHSMYRAQIDMMNINESHDDFQSAQKNYQEAKERWVESGGPELWRKMGERISDEDDDFSINHYEEIVRLASHYGPGDLTELEEYVHAEAEEIEEDIFNKEPWEIPIDLL